MLGEIIDVRNEIFTQFKILQEAKVIQMRI